MAKYNKFSKIINGFTCKKLNNIMQFKKWLLKEDIFGFERQKEINVKSTKLKEPDNLPIVSIDIETTMDKLLQNKLNSQIPFSNFINEIQWGKEN